MKTLKDLTDALLAAGCVQPKMERSYPRKREGCREVLIRCWKRTGGKNKKAEREQQAEEVFAALRKEGFELTNTSWEYSAGTATEIWVQAKVALSDAW